MSSLVGVAVLEVEYKDFLEAKLLGKLEDGRSVICWPTGLGVTGRGQRPELETSEGWLLFWFVNGMELVFKLLKLS